MSPPASAAKSDSFQLRTWLEETLKRTVQLRSTLAPMSEIIRIAHNAQMSTLPCSAGRRLKRIIVFPLGATSATPSVSQISRRIDRGAAALGHIAAGSENRLEGNAGFCVLGVGQLNVRGLRHQLIRARGDCRDGSVLGPQDRCAANRVNHGARRVAVIHLTSTRRVRHRGSSRRSDQIRVSYGLGLTGLDDVGWDRNGDRLQIGRGYDDEAALHIAAQVLDNPDLLHVRPKKGVDRVKTFL